jgi:ABC-2 type transport system ATP-binding protein
MPSVVAEPQDAVAATSRSRTSSSAVSPLAATGDQFTLSRTLLHELIAFVGQRQSATLAQMHEHAREAAARTALLDRRHAGALERLDGVEDRIDRLSARVQELRDAVRVLRQPSSPEQSSPEQPPVVDGQPPAEVTTDGHVERFERGKTLLRVENLSKEIGGADILQDINFEIFENEILGLIGPNGAGKTTLMECLASLRPRTSGTFYEGGEAPPDWDPRRLMFYLPNGVAPYAEFYTIDVLQLFGRLYEVEPYRWERIIVEELALVPVLRKKISTLSKGNLQRLLIALALMSPQPLLALDEPFDGLDLHQTRAMMGILRGLRAQRRTLLLCIHQLTDAERICDRLLLVSNGRLVGMGTLPELRAQAGLSQGNLEDIFLKLTGRRESLSAAV